VTCTASGTAPFLLEQATDVVAKLNVINPWIVDSVWSMRLADGTDGGPMAAMPAQVVVDTPTQAYVLRYDRNDIAVIDEAEIGVGGPPLATIDLSPYLEPGDADGVVEMTAAVYVAATHRLYVVLGNVNQIVDATYGAAICGTGTSTLVAINTVTNSVVNLGGGGPSGAINLLYRNPLSLTYDALGNRLIIVEEGCYAKPATVGGALGAPGSGGVEALALNAVASTSLLAFTANQFPAGFVNVPTSFVYIDASHAILGFDGTGQAVYAWDPSKTTLGSVIPNAPDSFAYDGAGHLLGTREDTTGAGASSTSVVSVTIATGSSVTLASDVATLSGNTYVSSVDVWPHP
jgi:hypothetical protein